MKFSSLKEKKECEIHVLKVIYRLGTYSTKYLK